MRCDKKPKQVHYRVQDGSDFLIIPLNFSDVRHWFGTKAAGKAASLEEPVISMLFLVGLAGFNWWPLFHSSMLFSLAVWISMCSNLPMTDEIFLRLLLTCTFPGAKYAVCHTGSFTSNLKWLKTPPTPIVHKRKYSLSYLVSKTKSLLSFHISPLLYFALCVFKCSPSNPVLILLHFLRLTALLPLYFLSPFPHLYISAYG